MAFQITRRSSVDALPYRIYARPVSLVLGNCVANGKSAANSLAISRIGRSCSFPAESAYPRRPNFSRKLPGISLNQSASCGQPSAVTYFARNPESCSAFRTARTFAFPNGCDKTIIYSTISP